MSAKALVVNCSAPNYNLGALKLADWLRAQGYAVTTAEGDPGIFAYGYDVVALSVIFSWHAPIARDVALRVRADSDVWCGGPGMSALIGWWHEETGLQATKGLDARFERQRGDYRMTFAMRGCSSACTFCIVPHIEGREFKLDRGFVPAPILCDNNLSAPPAEHQDFILARYRAAGMTLVDANSGFEPKYFTEESHERWRHQLKGPWRFGFDEQRESGYVESMMRLLSSYPARRKCAWVLIGNESIDECYDRALSVLAWGGEPWCQPRMRLNVLSKRDLWLVDGWTPQLARDFCRYFNRRLWRYIPIGEYRPRQGEAPPFRAIMGNVGTLEVA